VLIAGGGTATAELYDPTSGSFTATASDMTESRSGHTATLLEGSDGAQNGYVLMDQAHGVSLVQFQTVQKSGTGSKRQRSSRWCDTLSAADSTLGAAQAMRVGSPRSAESTAAEAARKVSRRLGFVPALVMHGGSDTVVDRNAEQTIAQFQKFAELLSVPPQPLVEACITGDGRS